MSTHIATGKVVLVGAGPGAADLITLRGWRQLLSCDALVYDHLVASELVEACPAPIKVYVGKVAGQHAMPQPQINALLVELASDPARPRTVVRLKGGDPFLFGRGGEEALACAKAGIACEVISGVTAGIAAPAAAGVPVTHRDYTKGVVFVTGHIQGDGALDLPWEALATSGLTVVFFMAVSTAGRVAEHLMSAGMNPATPALVVQEGTTARQRSVQTTLSTLGEAVLRSGITAPAILVVGQVASMAEELSERPVRNVIPGLWQDAGEFSMDEVVNRG